jgi:hypothetical protein
MAFCAVFRTMRGREVTPKKSLAVAVLNVGGRCLHEKSRESIESAASRWGCDFVEIKEKVADVHPFWQKMFLPLHLEGYDRVLQIDADVLIRSDAPSPFDDCDEGMVGVVQDAQVRHAYRSVTLERVRSRQTALWSHVSGIQDISDSEHINAGFILYSPRRHSDLFQEVRSIGEGFRWFSVGLPEQSCLSLVLAKSPDRREMMPHTWNTVSIISKWRPRFGPGKMKSYVYHFNACRNQAKKDAAIVTVDWRA